jgi:uncharacterized protein (TIGR02118 family)
MIRVHVTYPRTEGSKFDAEYWVNTHMPLVSEHWPQAVRWEADLAGEDTPHYAAAHIFFESMDDFGAAVGGPGGAVVMADIANYTDVQPGLTIYNVTASS